MVVKIAFETCCGRTVAHIDREERHVETDAQENRVIRQDHLGIKSFRREERHPAN